jgi:copper chaperone CopZ
MSTAVALIAVCLGLVGLGVVITLTVVRPSGAARLTAAAPKHYDTRGAFGLHEISTRHEYPQRVSSSIGRKEPSMETLLYSVPGMHCGHCEQAVREEVSAVPGVAAVAVDLDAKRVEVRGESLDDAAIRAAIDEAGYEAA